MWTVLLHGIPAVKDGTPVRISMIGPGRASRWAPPPLPPTRRADDTADRTECKEEHRELTVHGLPTENSDSADNEEQYADRPDALEHGVKHDAHPTGSSRWRAPTRWRDSPSVAAPGTRHSASRPGCPGPRRYLRSLAAAQTTDSAAWPSHPRRVREPLQITA
jgi:hypothetical protein